MIHQVSRKSALLGVAGVTVLLAISIGIAMNAGSSPVADISRTRTKVASRALVFRDAPAGGIAVFDEGADKPFEVLPRDGNNFMATALRLLARERTHRSAAGPETPFILTEWSDGQLTFNDPATGETLELGAFGHTNAATFVHLLPPKSKTQ